MKVKVTIDGVEREVEVGNLVDPGSDEFKTQYVLKAVHDHEMGRQRKEAAALKDPAKLLEDDEFKGKALSAWGIDPSGKAKLTAEQLQEVRESVTKQQVTPLQEQLAKAKGAIDRLRRKELEGQILEAARGVVRDEFLTRPTPLARPLIVSMLEEQFGFDEESDGWAVKKAQGEGYEYAAKPEHGRPWMGPAEFLAGWAIKDPAKPFLRDQRQKIPGAGQPPANRGGTTISQQDEAGFLDNLKDIATGKVSVAP